jgi:hypothetical protein
LLPKKDQAEKVSVLCDWCNDNEWFCGINEMHQMDLLTENGIQLSYENLKDFNCHQSMYTCFVEVIASPRMSCKEAISRKDSRDSQQLLSSEKATG